MAPPLCKLGRIFDHTKECFIRFFGPEPNFGQKIGLNLSEDFFFCSTPNFGQKSGLNLSDDFFFALDLILGGKLSYSALCSSQIF